MGGVAGTVVITMSGDTNNQEDPACYKIQKAAVKVPAAFTFPSARSEFESYCVTRPGICSVRLSFLICERGTVAPTLLG